MKENFNWDDFWFIVQIVFGFIFFISWMLASIILPWYYYGWQAGVAASIMILLIIITKFID